MLKVEYHQSSGHVKCGDSKQSLSRLSTSQRQESSIPTSPFKTSQIPPFIKALLQDSLLPVILISPSGPSPLQQKTMPIPESREFLAKKPKAPPTFAGVDYDDNKALKAAQDAIIREQWVKSMMARIVRDELGKCYYREGVNHLQNCGKLRERYLELLKDAKIKGYLFEMQNILPGQTK